MEGRRPGARAPLRRGHAPLRCADGVERARPFARDCRVARARRVPRLELTRIELRFGDMVALEDVSLSAGPGEIVGVTGPSGAGKSTLCRVVGGLEQPFAGAVLIDGRPVTAVAPERRGVAFMFESYALYPRLTVFDNVAFPLRAP